MELTKEMRETLLSHLKEAQERKERFKKCLDQEVRAELKQAWNVDIWLAERQIDEIEQAIVNNELKDF